MSFNTKEIALEQAIEQHLAGTTREAVAEDAVATNRHWVSGGASLLYSADHRGWECATKIQRSARAEAGQFFSPKPVAKFLSLWFSSESFNQPQVHLIDPGAGGGVLTAAVVSRILQLHTQGQLPHLKKIILTTWEIDARFHSALQRTLFECKRKLQNVGIDAETHQRSSNYVLEAVADLESNLFHSASNPMQFLILRTVN